MEKDTAPNERSRLVQSYSMMSNIVRKGVRGTTRDNTSRTTTSESVSTGSSNVGRMIGKLHAIRSTIKGNNNSSKTRCDSDSIDDERSTENLSNKLEASTSGALTESDSDSDEERRRIDMIFNNRQQQQQRDMVPKSGQVTRDTSGNTDVSSSTSDSDYDDSFDVNDDQPTTRKVSFSNVSMRTYSLVLGETQASKSYPISLDWAHTPTKTIDISVFELLYSSSRNISRNSNNQCKMIRGFRLPRRLRTAQRLELLSSVTGQRPEVIYETNLARITREKEYMPETACCSDDGYVELRDAPYQMIDSDDYTQVVI